MIVARVTLSDRASSGIYEDKSGPEVERVFTEHLWADAGPELSWLPVLLPDDKASIIRSLINLADVSSCSLVLTTGGTGPSSRDVTPEATLAVISKELPGFGEVIRMISFPVVPTAILSRATAGIRGHTLIINLPGNPKAIGECLPALMPAIREAMLHIGSITVEGEKTRAREKLPS